MLTPVDQPLDKLEDLKPDEMYVNPSFSSEYALTVALSCQREHEGSV